MTDRKQKSPPTTWWKGFPYSFPVRRKGLTRQSPRRRMGKRPSLRQVFRLVPPAPAFPESSSGSRGDRHFTELTAAGPLPISTGFPIKPQGAPKAKSGYCGGRRGVKEIRLGGQGAFVDVSARPQLFSAFTWLVLKIRKDDKTT